MPPDIILTSHNFPFIREMPINVCIALQGKQMIPVLNGLKCRAACVGNHDLVGARSTSS